MSTPESADTPSRDTDSPRRRALSRDLLAAAERVAQAGRARERNARLAAAAALAQAAASSRDSAPGRAGEGDAGRTSPGSTKRG